VAASEVKHTDRALVKSNGMRFDADMEHSRPEAGVETRTLTAMIAARVRVLRREMRLSGAVLAAGMKDRGIPWNRTTVAKLETGRRESITVPELLALAQVLGIPPVLLLADPRRDVGPILISEGVELGAWEVLLWTIGSGTIGHGIASHPRSSTAMDLIWCGRVVAEVAGLVERMPVEMIDQWRTRGVSHLQVTDGVEREDVTRRTVDDLHRQSLEEMRAALERIEELGAPLPQVSEKVRKRAAELDVELPGQDGEG